MAPPVPPTTEEGESFAVAPQGGASASTDTQPNGPRSWERPWTIEEMRREAGNWSLAGDAGLLHMLKEFSQRMIARTHEMEKEVDGLVHDAKLTGVRLNNVTNDFIMLANTQFVENRVYDEDVTQEATPGDEKKTEPVEKTREQREAELIPKVSEALTYGINVIDQAFEKLDTHVADSDSEDEEAGYKVDPILEAKDPYVTRPLPCLIGSAPFLQDDNVGLIEDVSDEEAETEGSISESEEEMKDEDSETTEYSDSEDERTKPSSAKPKRVKDSDESESETDSEETESDEDMFTAKKSKKISGSDEDEDDDNTDEEYSDEEKDEEENREKDVSKPGGGDFASELAARIGAAIPKPAPHPADSDEAGGEWGEEEVRPTRTESRAKSEEKKESKKGKEKKGKGKGKYSKPKDDEEEDLFGQSTRVEEEDGLFGKPGGLFSSSKGLFDDDDDGTGGGLFDEVEKPKVASSKKIKPVATTVSDDADETEPEPVSRGRTASGKKIPKGGVSIFGGGDDDLFTSAKAEDNLFGASGKSEDTAQDRKPSNASVKAPAQKSGGGGVGGGLFDEDDEEDDLFGSASKTVKSAPKAEVPKKPAVSKTDLFAEDEDEDDLFGSVTTPKSAPEPEPEPEPETKPAAKQKKMPAGAVSMFGGAGNPMLGALKKRQPDSDNEEESPENKSSQSSSVKSSSSATPIAVSKVAAPSRTPLGGGSSSLFDEDDEDDLFSTKPRAESKTKPKSAAPAPAAKKAGEDALFVGEKKEGGDLFSDKKPAPAPAAETKKSAEKKEKADALFDGDAEEEDLFAAVAKPKDSGKKKPAGGVSLFGGVDVFGTKSKEPEAAKEEARAPKAEAPPPAKSTPQKKLVSLFDAEEVDEGDLFSPPTTKQPVSDARKERSKSKGLFDDEDVLFGTPEEAPSVDIFSKSPPAAAQKPKAEPAPAPQKKETKPPPPVASKAAPPSSSLFVDDDDDDLFSTSAKAAVAKTVPIAGATTTESSDAAVEEKEPEPEPPKPAPEPAKPKKPVGGVSMFGGLDPLTLLKKKPVVDETDKNESMSTEAEAEEPADKKTKEKVEKVEAKEDKKSPPPPPPPVAEKTSKGKDVLFADEDEEDDLFASKPKAPAAAKAPPIVAPKAQRPKVEVPSPPGFTNSPIPPSPSEGPKSPESPKPPLSPPTESKPFKKPIGGVSLFGGVGPLAELKKRTSSMSQSDDTSPSSETPSEVQSPMTPTSPDLLDSEPKPAPKMVSFAARHPLAGKVSSLQKNLVLNPAALLPGATPPSHEVEPAAVGFEDPADVNTLQSASKDRAKLTRRRPQSRKARRTAALTSGISFDDPTSPTSPDLPPIPDEEPSTSKPKSDLFGNDDLFAEEPSTSMAPPRIGKSEDKSEDPFKKGLFENDVGAKKSVPMVKSSVEDDDIFSDSKAKSKKTNDIFSNPKPKPAADDLFGSAEVKPNSKQAGTAEKPKDNDKDDLFPSSASSKKDSSSTKSSEPSSTASSGSKSTKAASVDDDDIFADSSLNKKKDKEAPPVGDIFVDSSVASKPALTKTEDEDDIFASAGSTTATKEKRKPKKATTKEETLFKDDTDIFADLPATKSKEPKKKKKAAEKKGVLKEDVDDIFADVAPAAPKGKKETKKKSAAASDAKAATASKDTDNIFDDPLNLTGK